MIWDDHFFCGEDLMRTRPRGSIFSPLLVITGVNKKLKSRLFARTLADRNSTLTDSLIHFLVRQTEIWWQTVMKQGDYPYYPSYTIEQNVDKIIPKDPYHAALASNCLVALNPSKIHSSRPLLLASPPLHSSITWKNGEPMKN